MFLLTNYALKQTKLLVSPSAKPGSPPDKDSSFVLLGPKKKSVEALKSRRNVPAALAPVCSLLGPLETGYAGGPVAVTVAVAVQVLLLYGDHHGTGRCGRD